MITRRSIVLGCATSLFADLKTDVRLLRIPAGGLQPQAAADENGTIHLLYFAGEPRNGDVFYARGDSFSNPLRVNSQEGSAIAAGTIRGAQFALGAGGRVHAAWNGSQKAAPRGPMNPDSHAPGEPMLYAGSGDDAPHFDEQRNLMHHTFGLDGGGSVAADRAGNVYVAWHGIAESEARSSQGEARRRVWIARSADNGRSFGEEAAAWTQATGACGCCGMKIHAGRDGSVTVLYRSATESVHRDIYVLRASGPGRPFQGRLLHKWEINACPMSSMDIADNGQETVAAWETGGQVFWTVLGRDLAAAPIAAPGDGKGRKHPRIEINANGEVLLVWTEGTGWQKGGSFAWQKFDLNGRPLGNYRSLPGIPAWSFAAVVAQPDNRFTILY